MLHILENMKKIITLPYFHNLDNYLLNKATYNKVPIYYIKGINIYNYVKGCILFRRASQDFSGVKYIGKM
jgi:hypothetical protein